MTFYFFQVMFVFRFQTHKSRVVFVFEILDILITFLRHYTFFNKLMLNSEFSEKLQIFILKKLFKLLSNILEFYQLFFINKAR